MSIILDFLVNVCVGAIGLIVMLIFSCILAFVIGMVLDFVTTKYDIMRKVFDIGIKVICAIILIVACYGTGFGILEKFL